MFRNQQMCGGCENSRVLFLVFCKAFESSFAQNKDEARLFGIVLRDGLGAFRDGVLGQFAWQQETNSGLNLATRNRALLVVASQTTRFGRNALKQIMDKVVHDRHALLGNTSVRVNLFELRHTTTERDVTKTHKERSTKRRQKTQNRRANFRTCLRTL